MPFRFRRSIGNKFFRVNFSKSGVSTTAGVPGVHVTQGPRGTTVSTGIPGSGISYSKKIRTPEPKPGPVEVKAVIHPVMGSPLYLAGLGQKTGQAQSMIILSVVGIVIFLILVLVALFSNSLSGLLVFFTLVLLCFYLLYRNYLTLCDLKDLKNGQIPKDWSQEKIEAARKNAELIERKQREREEAAKQYAIQQEQQKQYEIQKTFWNQRLDRLDVEEFSKEIVNLFINQFSVSVIWEELLTGEAKATVIQPQNEAPIMILVVHTFEPIGVDMARKLYGMTMRSKACHGFLFCNSTFTRNAEKEVVGKPIALFPRNITIEVLARGRFSK